MFFKARKSKDSRLANVGLEHDRLIPCGSKPNCVCSFGHDAGSQHHIAALEFADDQLTLVEWQKIARTMNKMGFELVTQTDDYYHYTHTSKIFGFVDDIEFHRPPAAKRIDLKSSSRVGYSDLGANRRRLESILAELKK